MTGIAIDLFTVILMVVLSFICGYSAGHKYGRMEVRKSLNDLSSTITKLAEGQKNEKEHKF